MLYSGKQSDALNHLRYVTYMHLIARSSTRPRPERLPPTDDDDGGADEVVVADEAEVA